MAKKSGGGFNIRELLQNKANAGAGPAMPTAAPTKKKGKKQPMGGGGGDVIGQPTPQTPPGGMGMGM